MDQVNEATERAARARFADPVRTTRARIRDAAIARFATDGVAAANLKMIAADAEVSSASLVSYHFGKILARTTLDESRCDSGATAAASRDRDVDGCQERRSPVEPVSTASHPADEVQKPEPMQRRS